jgi:hypothetical protein
MDNNELEQQLAKEWVKLRGDAAIASSRVRSIEGQLSELMDARDGRVIKVVMSLPIDNYTIERTFSPAYLQERLRPLRELLDEQELEQIYTEEFTYDKQEVVVVPAKWLISQVKKMADDKGGEIKKIVEKSKANSMNSTPRFRLTRDNWNDGESELKEDEEQDSGTR